jgi:DNA polymerase/3'-5' exonuclease PolX
MADNRRNILDKLIAIHGIGPSQAKELIALGVTKKSDLKKAAIWSTLHEDTKQYLTLNPKSISAKSIQNFNALLQKLLGSIAGIHAIDITGSYRRGKPKSNDIDVLITFKTITYPTEIYNKILSQEAKDLGLHFHKPFQNGKDKIATIVTFNDGQKHVVKVDFFISNKASYPFQLLYTTGSRNLNLISRKVAQNKGYLLNQNGLYTVSTKQSEFMAKPSKRLTSVKHFNTEEEILRFLQLEKYIPIAARDI